MRFLTGYVVGGARTATQPQYVDGADGWLMCCRKWNRMKGHLKKAFVPLDKPLTSFSFTANMDLGACLPHVFLEDVLSGVKSYRHQWHVLWTNNLNVIANPRYDAQRFVVEDYVL